MDLPEFFFKLHATVHASDVYPGRGPTVERWLGGLSEEQMRARPGKGLNSILWLLWHTARTEDAAVNLVVHAGTQVLDEGWARRMLGPATSSARCRRRSGRRCHCRWSR